MFIISEVHIVHWMWVGRGTQESFVATGIFAIYTFTAMR